MFSKALPADQCLFVFEVNKLRGHVALHPGCMYHYPHVGLSFVSGLFVSAKYLIFILIWLILAYF